METILGWVMNTGRDRRPRFASVPRTSGSSFFFQEGTWISNAPWARWSRRRRRWDDGARALSRHVSCLTRGPSCPFSPGSVSGIGTCGSSCRHWEGSVCSSTSTSTSILTSSCAFSSFCLCPSLCPSLCSCLYLCLFLCPFLCLSPVLSLVLCLSPGLSLALVLGLCPSLALSLVLSLCCCPDLSLLLWR